MKRTMIAFYLLLAVSPFAVAAEGPSFDRGKELFESVKLGTSGKSCASCHPGGRKLEWAATFDEEKLKGIINECIKKPLKGKAIDPGSDDMKSLLMYVQSFAGPGK